MSDSIHLRHSNHEVEENSCGRLTRRESLKWLGVISAGLGLPLISSCKIMTDTTAERAGHWPELNLEPITSEGYGTDPGLVTPTRQPWPLTMTAEQRELTAVIADILIPGEGGSPSASEVNVTDLIDEWVSAPYPRFQSDRLEILSGFIWLDVESRRRFNRKFVLASTQQRLEIIDDIAYKEARSDPGFARMASVFDGIRRLVVTAYFSSPEGAGDLGYQGNIPISGNYPGPTSEAMAHLETVLHELGLAEFR